MTDNPLFYRTIVPINRENHRALHLETSPTRFGFAAQSHLIPTVTDEFAIATRYLPIVFLPGQTQPSAVFLVGMRPGENLFIDKAGNWTADYIPSYLRRYPFMMGDVIDAEPIVCIDEASGLLGEAGEALFDHDGKESPTFVTAIQLVADYKAAATRTEAFVAMLQKLDLFRSITIDIRLGGQDGRTLHGLMSIDEEKLNRLPDEQFLSLRAGGFLPLIYLQLQSLTALDRLRLAQPPTAEAPAASMEPASTT